MNDGTSLISHDQLQTFVYAVFAGLVVLFVVSMLLSGGPAARSTWKQWRSERRLARMISREERSWRR